MPPGWRLVAGPAPAAGHERRSTKLVRPCPSPDYCSSRSHPSGNRSPSPMNPRPFTAALLALAAPPAYCTPRSHPPGTRTPPPMNPRPFPAALLARAAAPAMARAQNVARPPDVAAFVVTIGRDTLAVERYSRDGDSIVGELVSRSP